LRQYHVLAWLLLASRPLLAQTAPIANDPVVNDPVRGDTLFPPNTAELSFESHGSRLNGFFYLAQGGAPHPTVILLHGFPGNERNLDVAQSLRRAGMNVLYFDYRGSWGSAGTFSFAHTLEDVASAIEFVRSDSSIKGFRVDPKRLILLGHSMGGWLALMGAAADSSIACSVALDFWNVGEDGREMITNRAADSTATSYIKSVTAPGAPLRAEGLALVAEMKAQGNEWDPVQSARLLRAHPLLLISTAANQSHPRLVSAIRGSGTNLLTALQWKTDHGFSDRRIRLARTVVAWAEKRCAR
jgi:pimeloyl-ACP methyl ester carboxylesterase